MRHPRSVIYILHTLYSILYFILFYRVTKNIEHRCSLQFSMLMLSYTYISINNHLAGSCDVPLAYQV